MRSIFLVLGLGLLVANVGCNDTVPPNSKADRVEKEVGEAVDAVGDYTEEQKVKLVDSVKESLGELDSRMETLQQKGNELAGDAKANWEHRKAELETQRQALQERLNELRDSSGNAWKDLSHGVTSAWDELKKSFDDAAMEFKDD